MFSNMGNLKPDLTVTTEIENLPLNISFEEEKEIRDFDNNLKTLKKDAISLDVFKSAITEDKGIEITILFRNGYDKAAKIEKLPITIENFNGLPICKVVFEDSNGLVEVNPRKSKLVKFKIEECKLYTKVFDLDRCKILYK